MTELETILGAYAETFPKSPRKAENVYGYVLRKGKRAVSKEPLTDEQMGYLLELAGCEDMEAKQCFYNASVLLIRDFGTKRLKYYEGYVLLDGLTFPILHAWLELDGKLVDVTLQHENSDGRAEDLSDRILGVIPPQLQYYGVPMDTQLLIDNLLEKGESFSLIDNWPEHWPLLKDRKK